MCLPFLHFHVNERRIKNSLKSYFKVYIFNCWYYPTIYPEFAQPLDSVCLCLLLFLSVFRQYFFEYIFNPRSCLQDSNYPNINSSVIVSQICEVLFILFLLISFFLFYLTYINTVDLPSSLVSIL